MTTSKVVFTDQRQVLDEFDLSQKQVTELLRVDSKALKALALPCYKAPQSNRTYYRSCDVNRVIQRSIHNLPQPLKG